MKPVSWTWTFLIHIALSSILLGQDQTEIESIFKAATTNYSAIRSSDVTLEVSTDEFKILRDGSRVESKTIRRSRHWTDKDRDIVCVLDSFDGEGLQRIDMELFIDGELTVRNVVTGQLASKFLEYEAYIEGSSKPYVELFCIVPISNIPRKKYDAYLDELSGQGKIPGWRLKRFADGAASISLISLDFEPGFESNRQILFSATSLLPLKQSVVVKRKGSSSEESDYYFLHEDIIKYIEKDGLSLQDIGSSMEETKNTLDNPVAQRVIHRSLKYVWHEVNGNLESLPTKKLVQDLEQNRIVELLDFPE